MIAALKKRAEMARNDISVKLDAQIARKAKLVATNRGINLAAYLSEVLRPIVERDLKDEMAKMLVESPKPKTKPKGDQAAQ